MDLQNDKGMKILYLSRPSYGDCDFPLIKALMGLGHEVVSLYHIAPYEMHKTIFDIGVLKPYSRIYPASQYEDFVRLHNYLSLDNFYIANDTTGKIGWKSIMLAVREVLFIKNAKPDIINVVGAPGILLSCFLWLFRKKLVVVIHDGKPHTGEGNMRGQLIRILMKTYVRKYIFLNEGERVVFSKEYGVSMEKLYCSRLGYYDILSCYGNSKTKELSGEYVLFCGRVSPYKGIEYLLEAMTIVHETWPNMKVIIAGKGKYYFDITQYEKLDYVTFMNRYVTMDELADLINGALFTICPYTDATQSGVIFSSFALNKPVIASSVGGIPDVVEQNKTGILVPPKDAKALSMAILKCLNNREFLHELSCNIKRNTMEGKWAWHNIALEYVKIYQS